MTAAGFPALLVQLAFTTPFNDTTPDWEDLTGYTMGFSTKRGRPSELTTCEPGTLTLRLDNSLDVFNPDNVTGPWYGYIRPNRRIRIGATVDGDYYPIFTGFVDAFTSSFDPDVTVVTATDRFKLLARRTDSLNSRPDEAADVRITALLQHSGIGSGDRDINPDSFAAREVATYDYDGDPLLQALQDAAHSDGGLLFMDGWGKVAYQTVRYRQIGGATRARTSQARFGNDPTSIGVENDLDPTVDDTLMANKVYVQDCNSDQQLAEDTSYQDDDGLLELDLGATLLLPSDAADRVADVLSVRKRPTPRYDKVTVDVLTQDVADQVLVFDRWLSDRVTVAVIPPDTFSGTARDEWVEGIEHDCTIAGDPSWRVTFGLSSAGDGFVVIGVGANAFDEGEYGDAVYG